MSYMQKIIHIACFPGRSSTQEPSYCLGYKNGHQYARHTAAEIAAEADTRIAALEAALTEASLWLHVAYNRPPLTPEAIAMLHHIDAALATQPKGETNDH